MPQFYTKKPPTGWIGGSNNKSILGLLGGNFNLQIKVVHDKGVSNST